jgi:hypothetical protein
LREPGLRLTDPDQAFYNIEMTIFLAEFIPPRNSKILDFGVPKGEAQTLELSKYEISYFLVLGVMFLPSRFRK